MSKTTKRIIPIVIILLVLALSTGKRSVTEETGTQGCFACHARPGLSVTQDGKQVSLEVDPARFEHSVHGKFTCSACHLGDPHAPGIPPELRGTETAMLARKLNRPMGAAQLSCGNCHPEEFAQYKESIHGQAAFRGVKQAPICSSCHGNHGVRGVYESESSVSPHNMPATCGSCHSNQRLMAQFNISTHTVSSYSQSFHGRRLALGSQKVAECSSCHGYHAIFAPTDPRSSVYPANRPKTCGKTGCHPGAGTNFAAGFAHRVPSPRIEPAAFWIGYMYNWMVLGVAAMMLLWVLADIFRRLRRFGFHAKAPHPTNLPVAPETQIHRWDLHQRAQHILLVLSFTTLVLTGVPMLFPISAISQHWMGFIGGPVRAGVIHRIAASCMMLGAMYHFIYLAWRLKKRRLGTSMLPNYKDMLDCMTMVRYYVGLAPEPPQYGWYTFDEKVEYWSMLWGTVVMVTTGFVLWFPLLPARFLGYWAVDVSRIMHGYEAMLAAIAIIIWHFYHAHLHPEVFPMNWVWLTGKVTAEEVALHHPAEFKRLLKEGKLPKKQDTGDT